MKKLFLLLITFFFFNIPVICQIFTENFNSYTSKKGMIKNWVSIGDFSLDTSINGSSNRNLSFIENSTFIIKESKEKIGKIELSLYPIGSGVWNITIYTTQNFDVKNQAHWIKSQNIKTNIQQQRFETRTLNINSLKKCAVIIVFELEGSNSQLHVDDIKLFAISDEIVERINEKERKKKQREEREADFAVFMKTKSFEDAKTLIDSSNSTYKSNIKPLSMLYKTTNVIKLLSGTAAALGTFNQLSNPTNFDPYKKLKKKLFVNLDPIDTLLFNDEVESKLNNFFKKIENPLNMVASVADIFTGGVVSKAISGFKSLITRGFSTEKLVSKGLKKSKLKNEKAKGVALYLDSKKFFEDIEKQNAETIGLNNKIISIYHKSKKLNSEIEAFFLEYLQLTNVNVNSDSVIYMSKNEKYTIYDEKINNYFTSLLGTHDDFSPQIITQKSRQIDNFSLKIDNYIDEYEKLSNKMSSFYSDFNKKVVGECPYRNATENDKTYWREQVKNIREKLTDVDTTFKKHYLNIVFK